MTAHTLILAAEDEESDILLLKMALKKSGLPHPLIVARNGQEVIDYLDGKPPYADRSAHPLPGLLLLDLKMPVMSGFDVLEWLAARPELQHVPAIVFSSSCHESDREKARRMGARDYLIKPHDFQELPRLLQQLSARWLTEAPKEPGFSTAPVHREQVRLRASRN